MQGRANLGLNIVDCFSDNSSVPPDDLTPDATLTILPYMLMRGARGRIEMIESFVVAIATKLRHGSKLVPSDRATRSTRAEMLGVVACTR